MNENQWIVTFLQNVIMDSMRKTPETGIACIEEIVLNKDTAKVVREYFKLSKATPVEAGLRTTPRPDLKPGQELLLNIDGVWLVEDVNAYQPVVIGPLVNELQRRQRTS